jgi:hypothetical protein
MRNGFLGSLLAVLLLSAPGSAQDPAEAPSFVPGLDSPWQPPRTELDDRPNVGPRGYAYYGEVDGMVWWTEREGRVFSLGNASRVKDVFGTGADFGALDRPGIQGTFGAWLDPQQIFGIEASGLWLWNRHPRWIGGSEDIGIADELGSHFWSCEIDGRAELHRGSCTHLDMLAGFRVVSLDESVEISERDFLRPLVTSDRFGTRNSFYGGQLGLEGDAHWGNWSLDVLAKVALGGDCTTVHVNGTTLAAWHDLPGGLIATPAVDGRSSGTAFCVVPQIDITGAYQLTDSIRVTVGYSFLYMSDVARPADQIDVLQSGTRRLPSIGSDFWGQGIRVGLEFRF